MKHKRFNIRIFIIATLGLFLAFTYFVYMQQMDTRRLPELGQVNNFSLIDQDSNAFALNQLEGKVWIANFFFTTCGDICPIMSKNMASLHRSFALVGDAYQVSITVHPEFDSSNILASYAQRYNADTDKWVFLTGSREEITKLAVESFKIGSIEEPVFHSAKFALVDRKGIIRGYYDGVNPGEVSQLFQDTALLLKE